MSETIASAGLFRVRAGEVDAFLERWTALISWTQTNHPGLQRATLSRSDTDPQQFVSFATWNSVAQRKAWRASDGYRARSAACRELCDEYIASDYHEIVAFGAADGH